MADPAPRLLTSGVKILKNNQEISNKLLAMIHSVEVHQEINTPAMFSFSYSCMSEQGNWQDIDLEEFKPGDEIEILMGFSELQSLIIGKITAVEPSFQQYATATIRGFDLMYQLKFGRFTKIFIQQPYSDIMQQLATMSQLTAEIEGNPGELTDSLFQSNQSNFDLMSELLAETNYEMLMQGRTLVIRPSTIGEGSIKTLQYPRNISQLDLNLKVPTSGDKVTVTGWDMLNNQAIEAEVSSASVQQRMGGDESGYQSADSFPSSAILIERQDISNPEALEVVARAEYQRNLNRFIQGNATLQGDTSMVAGVNITLAGLSTSFNGLYYVSSATHSFDTTTGYQTTLQLNRTGA